MLEPAVGGVARIGDIVADVLKRAGVAEQVERARVIEEWGARVGEGIAAVTGPLRLDDATLIVGVRSSAWLMELNLMKREILARLNEGRSSARIEKLVFVLAERG
ncbi:MAG: DUF721 domain-containing protein [Gemmatimonadetes bacterium]|nr:DUF721 domain-containing protein [Gemmatimonadota bacterium]